MSGELTNDRRSIRPNNKITDALLAGIIYCGECGARMRVKNSWHNHPCTTPKKVTMYYVCYSQDASAEHMVKNKKCKCGYKRADEIEDIVVGKLHESSINLGMVEREIEAILSPSGVVNVEAGIKQATSELASLDKKIDRWYSAFENGSIEPNELSARVKGLRDRKKHLESQIVEWDNELTNKADIEISKNEVMEVIKDFPSIWEEGTMEERRTIITNLLSEVIVFKDNSIKVSYNVSTCI